MVGQTSKEAQLVRGPTEPSREEGLVALAASVGGVLVLKPELPGSMLCPFASCRQLDFEYLEGGCSYWDEPTKACPLLAWVPLLPGMPARSRSPPLIPPVPVLPVPPVKPHWLSLTARSQHPSRRCPAPQAGPFTLMFPVAWCCCLFPPSKLQGELWQRWHLPFACTEVQPEPPQKTTPLSNATIRCPGPGTKEEHSQVLQRRQSWQGCPCFHNLIDLPPPSLFLCCFLGGWVCFA